VLGLATVFAFLGAILGVAMAARGPDSRLEPIIQAPKPAVKETGRATPRTQPTARRHMPIPVRISIPAIGVNARVIRLGLNPDRTIEVPTNFADTGWFRPGPEPGERGAAVILGHLDSRRSGPAVFFRLGELRAGDVIRVHLKDGSTVRFVAKSMLRVPKNRFPTKRVYARTSQPTLRLVTCAGRLNASTGHHDDNYIVFASIRR
jgi:sortase (surface protein transpeptidase)